MGGCGAGTAAGVGAGVAIGGGVGAGGGVNGGGGGGGGKSDGGWLGSGGLGGSFMIRLEAAERPILSGASPTVKPRPKRQEPRTDLTTRPAPRSIPNQNQTHVPHNTKIMKALPRLLILIAASSFFLAATRINARSMLDLPGFPIAALHVYLPAEAYAKLVNAPVKAYIQVRGQIVNSKVAGSRVIHSEGGGVYDKASMQIANGMQIYTDVTSSRLPPSVLVHVVIYQLPKGEHAIALAQDDSVGASYLVYSRSLKMVYLGLANEKQPAPKRK
jgi:hypothetical protein